MVALWRRGRPPPPSFTDALFAGCRPLVGDLGFRPINSQIVFVESPIAAPGYYVSTCPGGPELEGKNPPPA